MDDPQARTRELLLARVDGLRRQCAWVKQLPELRDQRSSRYRTACRHVTDRLGVCLRQLDELSGWMRYPGVTAEGASAWLEEHIEGPCGHLFNEAFALAQRRWLDESGIDRGMAALAEELVGFLSKRIDLVWGRPVVLAEQDWVTDLTGIVRLRFPALDVWNLPVVGHEFAHQLLTGAARADNPETLSLYDYLLEWQADNRDDELAHVHELAADLVATFCLGPAYACTCLLLRFKTQGADRDNTSHPCANTRVGWILEALRRMGGNLYIYDDIVRWLKAAWCAQAGIAFVPEMRRKPDFEALYSRLDQPVGPFRRLRYDGWERARVWKERLRGGDIGRAADTDIRDVINGAWYLRLNDPKVDSQGLHDRVMAWWGTEPPHRGD